MRKYLLVTAVFLQCSFLFAQNDITIKGTKKITKEMTPQQVIDSLNARFPDANSVAYYKVPANGVQNGWAVTEEDNTTSSDEVDYYTISFKREGLKYYGLYKKDGTLLNSKVEQSVADLPPAVAESLKHVAEDHPGYTIKSKTYFKTQNHSKTTEHYEVVATKGKTTKTLVYQADGKILKVKG